MEESDSPRCTSILSRFALYVQAVLKEFRCPCGAYEDVIVPAVENRRHDVMATSVKNLRGQIEAQCQDVHSSISDTVLVRGLNLRRLKFLFSKKGGKMETVKWAIVRPEPDTQAQPEGGAGAADGDDDDEEAARTGPSGDWILEDIE